MPTYLAYTFSVETPEPDEEQTFDAVRDTMKQISVTMNDQYRHAVRSVHAKSHGLLKAELRVLGNLPEPYAQGLFAAEATYGAMMRFSTNPGDILADSVSTPRGLAVKVVGVPGPMLGSHQGQSTQDFVFVNAKSFGMKNTKEFLKAQKLILANLNDPQIFKKLVSNVARGTNAALGVVGLESATLEQLGHPETNPLGETYGSCAALRYGNYVAKIIIEPRNENLKALYQKHVNVNFHFSGLRDAIVEFFKTNSAEWDVKVQLAIDSESTPIEDPSKPWPEDKTPYVPVARLIAEAQDAYSPPRRTYMDEELSFDPYHGLAAHQPLGNIMRARKKTYEMSRQFRRDNNGRKIEEPTSIDQLPA